METAGRVAVHSLSICRNVADLWVILIGILIPSFLKYSIDLVINSVRNVWNTKIDPLSVVIPMQVEDAVEKFRPSHVSDIHLNLKSG